MQFNEWFTSEISDFKESWSWVSEAKEHPSKEINRLRAQVEEDEYFETLTRGLQGQNLSDFLFVENDVQLLLAEVFNG